METILIVFFCCAVIFLCYVRASPPLLSNRLRQGVAISKYLVAVMAATYLSGAGAALIATPLLGYARLKHTQAPIILFSDLLDRPFFPLQMGVGFFAGLVATKCLKEGKPVFVWVLPVAQFLVALVVISSRHSAFQQTWSFVWSSFFNWSCHCSATLLQWKVMFPLYTSIAFSLGAYLSGTVTAKLSPSRAGGSFA